MLGQQLGSYVIERCIGDGAMGSVYLGINPSSGERVAIKVLRPELARNAEMVERIVREGKAARSIAHPGVVKILDSGVTPKGRPYMIMEYLEGQPLSSYLAERKKLPVAEALRIGQELAAALLAAHTKQVIHRDLKPENIFRMVPENPSEPPHVKILDFGIALVETPADRKRLTRAGTLLGTPAYMAPEVVIDPRAASAASDVYALGVILYQMIVGEPPFTAECSNAVLFKQVSEPPPDLDAGAPGTPPALCTLVKRLLSKNPAERPTMIETFWVLLGLERSLPPPASLAQRLWRGSLVQRAVLWVAPSLFICAVAAGITPEPRHLAGSAAGRSAALPTAPAAPWPAAQPTAQPAPSPVFEPVFEPTFESPVADNSAVAKSEPGQIPPLRLASDAAVVAGGLRKTAAAPSEVQHRDSVMRLSSIEAARLAFAQHRYDDAILHARLAVKAKPYEAWVIIGRAACMKKDRLQIREALKRLDAPRQSMVTYTCLANRFNPN